MERWNRRSLNLSFLRRKPKEYIYIQDFENTNEKICKRCDKDNDVIYAKNSALYTKTKRFLEKNNAIFKMEGPPAPPRVPSNYELYIIHQNRNSHTNNKIQTIAILFLLQKGYRLVIDPDVEFLPKVMNKENKLFEPYMAIDIASSLDKEFIKSVAKTYQLNGRTLESPELMSLEEKIDKFNTSGMIQYLDVSSNSLTHSDFDHDKNVIQPSAPPASAPNRHPSAPPNLVSNGPASHETASHGPASHGPASHGPASHGPASHIERSNSAPATQITVPAFYPNLNNETQPPAYSSDNIQQGYGFEQQQSNEEGKINIIINKNK